MNDVRQKYFPLLLILFFISVISCQQNITIPGENLSAPPPFLTGKAWVLDTIIITPPDTYEALSDSAKMNYHWALGWDTGAIFIFNKDYTMNTPAGENVHWDFGYNKWRLINNNADLEVANSIGTDTLYSWFADSLHFHYNTLIGDSVLCTYEFRYP